MINIERLIIYLYVTIFCYSDLFWSYDTLSLVIHLLLCYPWLTADWVHSLSSLTYCYAIPDWLTADWVHSLSSLTCKRIMLMTRHPTSGPYTLHALGQSRLYDIALAGPTKKYSDTIYFSGFIYNDIDMMSQQ